jgi:hypothetical protein
VSVEEILMRPGAGRVNLIDSVPADLTKTIYDLLVGVGCHVVITPTPIDTTVMADADVLTAALYTGRVEARPDRTSIEFVGTSTWLDSYTDADLTRTAGTPTQWLGDTLINNLTTGTVSGGGNVTRTFLAHAQTRRQILDAVASEGGWEYVVRPDFKVDAGTSLFPVTPTVVITNKNEGRDGSFVGLLGGLADQNVDASGIATKVVALGQGIGTSIVTGSATKVVALKTQNGNTPTLVSVVSAPSVTVATAATVASTINTAATIVTAATVSTGAVRGGAVSDQRGIKFDSRSLNPGLAGNRRSQYENLAGGVGPAPVPDVPSYLPWLDASRFASSTVNATGPQSGLPSIGAESQFVRRLIRPGDNVYLYDIDSGLYDTANQIVYRGETIFPVKHRVLSMTWAIENGYGVYIRSNAATPAYYDLTPYVDWEQPGATLEVGSRPTTSYSTTVNRSDPAIEERVTQTTVAYGFLGQSAFGTSAQNIGTTLTDVTSSSVPVTIVNRRLLITGRFLYSQLTSAGTVQVVLTRNTTDIVYVEYFTAPLNSSKMVQFSVMDTPGAGSHTYKLRALTSAGTVTIANNVSEGIVVVFDVGA